LCVRASGTSPSTCRSPAWQHLLQISTAWATPDATDIRLPLIRPWLISFSLRTVTVFRRLEASPRETQIWRPPGDHKQSWTSAQRMSLL
jgi:hypothetical protein